MTQMTSCSSYQVIENLDSSAGYYDFMTDAPSEIVVIHPKAFYHNQLLVYRRAG